MEIQYYGGNCVRIGTKKGNIVVDDNLKVLGLKSITKPEDIALFTSDNPPVNKNQKIVINNPGEYEVSGISIWAIPARANIEEEGKTSNSVFKIIAGDISIAVIGHIFPELNDNQLEAIGKIDILIIPVGGAGYTMDGTGALNIIKEINPKIIIPTHYADKSINYPVAQSELAEVLKEISMEIHETIPKLKIKSSEIGELTRLIVLEKQ